MGTAKSSLTHWLYRRRLPHHRRRWQNIDEALKSPTRLRLILFLSQHGQATKSDIVQYLLETGQFDRRDSCIRVADRHLEQMQREGAVEIFGNGLVVLKRKTPLIIMEPPGLWVSAGTGLGIIFLGVGYLRDDPVVIGSAVALLAYSLGVVAHIFLKGSPY